MQVTSFNAVLDQLQSGRSHFVKVICYQGILFASQSCYLAAKFCSNGANHRAQVTKMHVEC